MPDAQSARSSNSRRGLVSAAGFPRLWLPGGDTVEQALAETQRELADTRAVLKRREREIGRLKALLATQEQRNAKLSREYDRVAARCDAMGALAAAHYRQLARQRTRRAARAIIAASSGKPATEEPDRHA